MMEQAEQNTFDFRARVTMEALRGDRTVEEIADRFGLRADQVAAWKLHAADISATLQLLCTCSKEESDRQAAQGTISWRDLHPFVSG